MRTMRPDVLDLEFTADYLQEIQRCLNCTLPESECKGNKRCKRKPQPMIEKIQAMARAGYSADDVKSELNITSDQLCTRINNAVRFHKITSEDREEIRRLFKRNKTKKTHATVEAT